MRVSLGLIALLTASCASSPAGPTAHIDTTFSITLGESVLVAPGSATIRFDAVTEDSRCPTGAYCVWAGRAGARLGVIMNANERSIQLLSDPKASRAATVDDLRVEWGQLDPYPSLTSPTEPGDYRLTVRVIR
jgi:hypothetical protein